MAYYLLTEGDTVKKRNSFWPVREGKSLYKYKIDKIASSVLNLRHLIKGAA